VLNVLLGSSYLLKLNSQSMCSVCISTVKRFFFRPDRNHQTNETRQMKTEELALETDKSEINPAKVVSEAEWLVALKDLRTSEKELTLLRDEVTRHSRKLPWGKFDKE